MNTEVQKPVSPAPPTSPDLGSVLVESAISAFVNAIIVLTVGSIAIAIVGNIAGSMTPSLPPALAEESGLIQEFLSGSKSVWSWLRNHGLLVTTALLFVLEVRMRLTPPAPDEAGARKATRAGKVSKRLSKEWFELIVGNAFGAVITAGIVVFLQKFSGTEWLFHWVMDLVRPVLQAIADRILGPEQVDSLLGWHGWYQQNQLKFTFWLFYLAGICDDLGIPNLKTLGRWLLRKLRKRFYPAVEQTSV